MRPRGDELLRSARWTLEHLVAPTVTDPLARSYLRAVDSLLEQVEIRFREEWPVLLEELDDLRRLLPALLGHAPELDRAVATALDHAEGGVARGEDLPAVEERVDRLRLPVQMACELGLHQVDGYLSRQVDRIQRCFPESRRPGF